MQYLRRNVTYRLIRVFSTATKTKNSKEINCFGIHSMNIFISITEPSKAVILSCAEALASMTNFQKRDFSSEYPGGSLPFLNL